jgi:large subunit ribosomal protein L21
MYAVIRAGGKQYRVAPGDVVRVETVEGPDGKVAFSDILAVSNEEGQVSKPGSHAQVIGQVVEQGRGSKVLVFHYKRKKQYKKIAGHRQPFTAVRITEISANGKTFTAPELPKKEAKPKKVKAEAHKAEAKAETKTKPSAKKKAASPKSAAKKSTHKKK